MTSHHIALLRGLARAPLSAEEQTRRAVALTVAETERPRPPMPPVEHRGEPNGEHANFVRALNGAAHQDEPIPERAAVVDPEWKPSEAPWKAVDEAGSSSETHARPSCPADGSDTGDAMRTVGAGESPAAYFDLPRVIRDGAPVDQWVRTESGLQRWRPIVDSWRIVAIPGGGRLIEISGARPKIARRCRQCGASRVAPDAGGMAHPPQRTRSGGWPMTIFDGGRNDDLLCAKPALCLGLLAQEMTPRERRRRRRAAVARAVGIGALWAGLALLLWPLLNLAYGLPLLSLGEVGRIINSGIAAAAGAYIALRLFGQPQDAGDE